MMLLFTPTADTYILILSRTHLYYRRYPDFLQYYFNRAYQWMMNDDAASDTAGDTDADADG